jgi:tripartite-type tricarboxylate transporter receptor subunit TctC
MSGLTSGRMIMRIGTGLLCACVATLASAGAFAQAYPTRAVRAIVPFAPGGGTDFIARVVLQKVSESWGQPIVVENRPGGTTIVASEIVSKAAPDGYTLLVTPVPFSIVPSLAKLAFDPLKDFEHIALFNIAPLVFIVNPGVPAKSVKELVALAKSKPGALNFGSSGNGSSNHLAGELFNAMAGVKMVHVPYKGSAPSLADLAGGHVDVVVSTLTSAIPLMKGGKVRAIAVTGLQRSAEWPDIPTMHESGLKGFQAEGWNGLSAPARTAREIVDRINGDVAKALAAPDVAEKFRREGASPKRLTPAEFSAFIREEIVKWGKVIKFAKVESL